MLKKELPFMSKSLLHKIMKIRKTSSKIYSVIGTRPQYIKLSVIERTCMKKEINHKFIDTGQHYSSELSTDVASDLRLSTPIKNLQISPNDQLNQISEMVLKLNEFLRSDRPDLLLVYGDTNSTLAASLVANRLKIPFGHIEAGLRSFNNLMPEETNRKIADHMASRLYAPTQIAMSNLKNEGLEAKSLLTGDLMLESLNYILENRIHVSIPKEKYFVATLHREENLNQIDRLATIFKQLSRIPDLILFFAHPRLLKVLKENSIEVSSNLRIMKPQTHSSTIHYISNSLGLITDSGGLQKEAFMMGVVCTTVRNDSEWTETFLGGWNVLCKDLNDLPSLVYRIKPETEPQSFYGMGNASELILDDILSYSI